jgi:hypothetical protein
MVDGVSMGRSEVERARPKSSVTFGIKLILEKYSRALLMCEFPSKKIVLKLYIYQ